MNEHVDLLQQLDVKERKQLMLDYNKVVSEGRWPRICNEH